MSLSRVRTIFNHGGESSLSVLGLMSMLRVVYFEGSCYSLHKHHHDFANLGKLYHLKYLRLRNTRIIELPKSCRKFYNLEVLDLRYTIIVKLPRWIGELRQLHHIYVGKLLHFVVAKGIRRLKFLQTLCHVDAGAAAKELEALSDLCKLSVGHLTEDDSMDFCASLAKLSCLRSLRIYMYANSGMISLDDDDVRSSPPLLLQHLRLRGPLVAVPRWVGSLREMVKLTLSWTGLGNDGIGLQLLQALPNLNHFELLWDSYMGDHLCFDGGFGSLKVLLLMGLKSMKSLEFQGGAMINLQTLHICNCDNLDPNFRCEDLTNLKVVKVNLKSEQVDRVRKIVEAHPAQPRFVVHHPWY